MGYDRDMTELGQIEQKIRESELRYRRLFETAQDGILILDAESGEITDANPFLLNILEYTLDEVQGKKLWEIGVIRDKAQAEQVAANLKKTGYIRYEDLPLATKDGRAIDVEFISNVYLVGEKKIIQCNIRDITDRKLTEQKIQESEKTFRELFNTVKEAIYVMDVDGRLLEVNQGARDMYGQPRDFFIGQSCDVLYAPGTFDMVLTINRLEEAFNREPLHFERTGRRSNGEIFPAECRLSRGHYFGKDVIIGLVIDITERKRAEMALHQANKQLNLLASITRHDILNQLMGLKEYLYLLNEPIDNPTIFIEYVQKVEQAANTIERLVTFTVDYQELGVAAPKWQNVNASAHKAITELPMRDVRVELDFVDPEVYADPLFEKVFYNLIDNALRYGGADMKTIRFSSGESATGLLIVCEDDGVGITAEDKKKLFTRGFGKNTGLGLFLSREILTITGITITENGIPGKGTRFEITVPKGAWRMKGGDA
jgi:PAS domain S-box-containing protein